MDIFWQYSSHIGWGNTKPKPIVTHSTSDFLNNSRLDTTVHCDTDDRGIGWVKISTVTCLELLLFCLYHVCLQVEGKHDTNKIIGSGIGCKLQLSYASRFLWTVLAVLYTTRQSDGQQFSSDVWVGLVHKWLWMVCISEKPNSERFLSWCTLCTQHEQWKVKIDGYMGRDNYMINSLCRLFLTNSGRVDCF